MSADEELYGRIVEAVPEGIWLVDPQGQTTFCNQRMAELLGADIESLRKFSCFDSVFPTDLEEAQRQFGLQIAGAGRPFDFRLRRVDGSALWVSISCKPMYDDKGNIIGLLGLFTDITERKQAEAALSESEERFRNMADTAPVMIWVAGPDKLCTFFNKNCLKFTGHSMEQKIGAGWIGGIHPEDRESVLAKYSSSFDARIEFQTVFRLRRADGEYRSVLTAGAPRFTAGAFAGFIGSCFDITDVLRTREEALARNKLEEIGVLASGIAHDFNNLLGGILAESDLANTELAAGKSPVESFQRIKAGAMRGAEIVRQLMMYSGQDETGPLGPVDLSALIKEMLDLLKISISKQVTLETDLASLPPVLGRASQIRQVLMNLVINASEAIGERSGLIRLATFLATPHSGEDGAPDLPWGEHLCLEVSDSGCGMNEDVRAKAFDPFFSTKFAGRGLGLAVVRGIVLNHGGALNLMSAPGQGTKFQIFFRVSKERARQDQSVTIAATNPRCDARTGTVLVVEDEELLRFPVAKALRKAGYSVLEASDGFSAKDLIRLHRDQISAILLDVTIAGSVSSREVFEEARRIKPRQHILLTSAYAREQIESTFPEHLSEHFIRKPFQLADLMDALEVP